jgi:hypothetical protein
VTTFVVARPVQAVVFWGEAVNGDRVEAADLAALLAGRLGLCARCRERMRCCADMLEVSARAQLIPVAGRKSREPD